MHRIKHRILNTQTTRSVHAEYNLVTTYENHQFMEPMSPVEIILPQNAEPNARIQKMKLFGLFLGMAHANMFEMITDKMNKVAAMAEDEIEFPCLRQFYEGCLSVPMMFKEAIPFARRKIPTSTQSDVPLSLTSV